MSDALKAQYKKENKAARLILSTSIKLRKLSIYDYCASDDETVQVSAFLDAFSGPAVGGINGKNDLWSSRYDVPAAESWLAQQRQLNVVKPRHFHGPLAFSECTNTTDHPHFTEVLLRMMNANTAIASPSSASPPQSPRLQAAAVGGITIMNLRRADSIYQDAASGQASWHNDGQHADRASGKSPTWSLVLLISSTGPATRLMVSDDEHSYGREYLEFTKKGDAALFGSLTAHCSVPPLVPGGSVADHTALKLVFLFW